MEKVFLLDSDAVKDYKYLTRTDEIEATSGANYSRETHGAVSQHTLEKVIKELIKGKIYKIFMNNKWFESYAKLEIEEVLLNKRETGCEPQEVALYSCEN